jgi:hypothetical protein
MAVLPYVCNYGKKFDFFLPFAASIHIYWEFRAQADWTFILLLELPAKELCHLPRKMLPHGTTF